MIVVGLYNPYSIPSAVADSSLYSTTHAESMQLRSTVIISPTKAYHPPPYAVQVFQPVEVSHLVELPGQSDVYVLYVTLVMVLGYAELV